MSYDGRWPMAIVPSDAASDFKIHRRILQQKIDVGDNLPVENAINDQRHAFLFSITGILKYIDHKLNTL